MNIYKSIGLEWLLENDIWDQLNNHICENTKYMVPGYKYNYRLCTFPSYIEFHRCELLNGTPVGIAMHFCAEHRWKLEVAYIDCSDGITHEYALKSKNGEVFSARVVSPDILPFVKTGDIFEGQVVAFANRIIKLPQDISVKGDVHPSDDNCIDLTCVITNVNLASFKFADKESKFWELDVETENGGLSVLIAEGSLDFIPEIGDVISAHALVSMDAAITQENSEGATFYTESYANIIDDDHNVYRNGFQPGFHRNQRAFINSIESGDLSRFTRCCENRISFINHNLDKGSRILGKEEIVNALKSSLFKMVEKVKVLHILSCATEALTGHDAITVYSKDGIELIIWFDVCEKGTIDEIRFLSLQDCALGLDYDLHLQAMFAHAICENKLHILHEYLDRGCMYRSEYADVCLVGAKYIIDRFWQIRENLNEENKYTFELQHSKDELYQINALPDIYKRDWCSIHYQFGKPVYILFLEYDNNYKITNVLLSRNEKFLKRFRVDKNTDDNNEEIMSVIDIVTSVYGTENTIETMRESEIPDDDVNGVYVWKKADEFAVSWLRENEYKISEAVLIEDCIGYSCTRRGTSYVVFFYAYGERKTVLLSGDYCAKLRREAIAQEKDIIIVYLHVEKKNNAKGVAEYSVGSYDDGTDKVEQWLLTTIKDRNVLRFYPSKEMMDLIPRLIAAYNAKDLDTLKAIFDKNATLETYESGGLSLNDGLYSHLSHIREKYGKMKLAYMRFSDVVYCAVPYIENYAYVTISASNIINSIKMNPLNDFYRELLIIEDDVDYCRDNDVPRLVDVEFMQPSEGLRFSIQLKFENGESRRYTLAGEFADEEVVKYQGKIMTDKIFLNGRLVNHIPLPDWMGYRNYAERGQGIEFVSGSAVSTIELYNNSYPIGRFNYAKYNAHVWQVDYDEDGFSVGYIPDLDPRNPDYLLDSNTMTAVAIPDEYQDTPIGVCPFYGGYSEGLVMVSKLGKLDLQYHHNRRSCAGIWGWLDKNLNVVIEPQYIYAMNFVNGRAIVCKGSWNVVTTEDGKEKYWCDNERWGVIDQSETEIVPCRYDELYEINNTDTLYLVHEGGWDNGHYAIFDTHMQDVILALDFNFDSGYMFNECYVTEGNILVFDEHLPGEGKDIVYAYDLVNKKYLVHGETLRGRDFNGETKVVVNVDGKDIIVF